MDEQIWRFLLDDVALDVCFEMHRQISVDGLSLEELYDVEPIERTGSMRCFSMQLCDAVAHSVVFVSCLYCKRQVHASRYTNHLEKCMTGSRRMVTPKQRQDAARETERKQLQTLSKPQLYGADAP
uniref:SAGA-associated factor 11 n=1 Tax=Phytophthora ramorum TaxID=164328 RepID=H3GCC7_PHYRM